MAKRNIRKTDPEIVTTPDRREASAGGPQRPRSRPENQPQPPEGRRPRRSRGYSTRTGNRGHPDYSRGRHRHARGRCEPRTESAPHARDVVHDCR